jgi:membrane associated rhomboid family serine protease
VDRTTRANGLIFVGVFVVLMWAVETVDVFAGDLDAHGIRPRDAAGLEGVATAPFLHAGFGHLLSNTLPFVVMGGVIALAGLARVAAVTAIVALVSGLGTWLVAASNTVHVGASGIVFGYAAYLLSRGIFSRRPLHLGVGALVLGIYGTTLLFGLRPTEGISWQGHLFGALGGLLAARVLDARRERAVAPPSYSAA